MRITGTKKFLIIILAFVCAVAAGLVGAFFNTNGQSGAFAETGKYPQSSEYAEIVYDEELLHTIADETGFEYDIINFYAHVFSVSAERIYEELKLDRDGVVADIQSVLGDYASGELNYQGEENIEEEDWFVAPDEVESYARAIGLQDTWMEYVTSPNRPVSNESNLYWGNENFTVGPKYRMPNEPWDYKGNPNPPSSWQSSYNAVGNGAWPQGNFFKYSWVWLDEGDEYQFGIKSSRSYNQVYIGAERADTFFEEKLKYETDTSIIGENSGNTIHPNNIQGYWFEADANGTFRGQDPQQRTLEQYKQDYATNIDPTTAPTTSKSTKFMKWNTRTTAAGYNKITITGDAPSGVYYLRVFRPGNNNSYRFVTDNASAVGGCGNGTNSGGNWIGIWFYPHNGWSINSEYCDYAIIVHRNTLTKPTVQIDSGVNDARDTRTVIYDSTQQTMTINNDWGEGLINFEATYTDASGTVTPITLTSSTSGNYITYKNTSLGFEMVRGAVGRASAKHEDLVLKATEKGTYTVTLTPFNKWSDGTSTPLSFKFNIIDRELEKPSLAADAGVSGNTKIVYDNGDYQYVSFYPVPQAYVNWTADNINELTGVSEYQWSDDGMLTLKAKAQGTYHITLSLKNTNNIKWTDGTTDPLEFTFIIGPRKIAISPSIIDTPGAEIDPVARTQISDFNGVEQTMSIMNVNSAQVSYELSFDPNNLFDTPLTTTGIKDGVLDVHALNAGTYYVTLKVLDKFCWEDGSVDPRVYTMTIHPKKITAPILKDTEDVENTGAGKWTKTVTFGGETNENGTQWFATLTFGNAYESRIAWDSLEMNKYNWGDDTLVLSARAAGTYTVTFHCKDNYVWADGVIVPEVTLIINRLKIKDPSLINDNEDGATYTSTQKTINCDFNLHSVILYIGMQGSVFVSYNQALERQWDTLDDGQSHTNTYTFGDTTDTYTLTTSYGQVGFTTNRAGTYNIILSPTSNYCWSDGTFGSRTFVFKITPSAVPTLQWELKNPANNSWNIVNGFDNGEGFSYDGTYREVRIGNGGEVGTAAPSGAYDTNWYSFYIVDAKGNIISKPEDLTARKIKTEVRDGYLYVSAIEADTYKIRVILKDTDYCFNSTEASVEAEGQSSITYKLQIGAQNIGDATLVERYDTTGGGTIIYDKDYPTTMFAEYRNSERVMYISVNEEFKDFVEWEYLGESDEYMKEYGFINEGDKTYLVFSAVIVGQHTVRLKIKDDNHKWGSGKDYYDFTIDVTPAPVSGIEAYYIEKDSDGSYENGTDIQIGSGGLVGGAKITYDSVKFSESNEYVFFKRTEAENYLKTSFKAQYDYEIVATLLTGETVEMTTHEYDDREYLLDGTTFNKDGRLLLSALRAGTYVIKVSPSSNYCWKRDSSSTEINVEPVTLTFKIGRMNVEVPEIMDDGDGADYTLAKSQLTKSVEFSKDYNTLSLSMGGHPAAYAVASWADESETWTDGNMKPVYPEDKDLLTVKALSTGTYSLVIQLSNKNDYEWSSAYDTVRYILSITKKGIKSPTAWLVADNSDKDGYLDAEDAASGNANPNVTALNGDNLYKAGVTYDGESHYVYLIGETVALLKSGDIVIEITSGANGKTGTTQQQVTYGDSNERIAFEFSASRVDTYVIKVKFASSDYYWTGTGINNDTQDRIFTLEVKTRVLSVPKLEGYEWQVLQDNGYTASFAFDGTNKSINITGLETGKKLTDGSYVFMNYSFKDADASGVSATTGADELDLLANNKLRMFTKGTYASAAVDYCLIISLDKANERWDTNDTVPKQYHIKINKMTVEIPNIQSATTLQNKYEKQVTYTGDAFNGALVLENIRVNETDNFATGLNTKYSLADGMTAVVDAVNNTVTISTDAPAKTYTVTVSLFDPDNMEWQGLDGSTDDLEFSLVVNPMPVAKPFIFVPAGSSEGQEGVVGFTRTVVYNGQQQEIRIGNYWADDPADWNNKTDNRWMYTETEATAWVNGVTVDFKDSVYQADFADFIAPGYKDPNAAYNGKYNSINKGLLTFKALDAGEYVIRFVLTGNAVWADGTDDPVELTLVIEKQKFATPYIYDDKDAEAQISGRTKTFEYKLDSNGDAVTRLMRVNEYDTAIMELFGTLDGNVTGTEGDIFYNFEAKNSGTYEITFRLKDFANQRWEYADKEEITFTFQINKLTLQKPVQTAEFKLPAEEINVNDNTLSIDYDDKEHTILILNVIEEYLTGSTNKYLWYEDTTPVYSGNMTPLKIKYYADTAGKTVIDLYGTSYDGPKKNLPVAIDGEALKNVVTITAKQTGEYKFTVHIADADNMQWTDGTADDITFTISIDKKVHDAPTVAKGTSRALQYTGEYVEFKIQDVFNSCNTEDEYINGTGSGFDYEAYEIINYDGTRTIPDLTDPVYEVSWYNGHLTLQFREVGTYYVKIWINLPDYTSWKNFTSSEIVIPLTVLPRDLTAEFTFSSTDEATNAELLNGANTWARSVPVTATLTFYNIVSEDVGGFKFPENNLEIKIYGSDALVPVDNILANDGGRWTNTLQPDGTWKISCSFNMPFAPAANVAVGNYTLYVEKLASDDSNYNIVASSASQKYTIKADPAPFKPENIVWQYSNSNDPTYFWDAQAGQDDANNRLHLDYLTNGGTWYVSMSVSGYATLQDALDAGEVKIDKVKGYSAAQDAGNYYYTIYITAKDPTLYSFPTTAYTLYYRIDPAKYNLNGVTWNYGGPYTYEPNTEYSVNVKGLPAGLTDKNYIVSGYANNKQTKAGTYTTAVNFQVQTNNYITPRMGDESTYEGTFDWTFTWEIRKKNITVGWDEGSYDADGGTITYNPVVDSNKEKFDYRYYVKADDSKTGCTLQNINGVWKYVDANGIEYNGLYVVNGSNVYVEISSVSGSMGAGTMFYVEAYLKPSYALNYTFDFGGAPDFTENGNFREFKFTNGTTIYDHITIGGKTDKQYEYTGKPYEANVVIDLDTTGGALDNGTVEIIYLYYLASDLNTPLSYIPYDIGEYVFRAKLVIRQGTTLYELSESEYRYEIIKATFDLNDFVWQYKHTDGEGNTVIAEYDETQNIWKNIETGSGVSFVYDGNPHEISLISNNANITAVPSQGTYYTNASTYNTAGSAYEPYTAEIAFIYDENRFNRPVHPVFSEDKTLTDEDGNVLTDTDGNPYTIFVWTIDWVVEKQTLDLSMVAWDYTNDYVFELVGGKATPYTVELTGLPAHLKDKIEYVTTLGGEFLNDGDKTNAGSYTDAGKYTTVATIDTDAIDTDNYILPAGAQTTYTLNWEIAVKLIDVPQRQPDFDWTVFDGNQHSLLTVLGIPADWEEYFTIKVTYANLDGGAESNYDGTKEYGSPFVAYNAGNYTLTFAIKTSLFNGTEANVAWRVPTGTADGTTDDQTVRVTVNKATLKVIDWNRDYESSTVKLESGEFASAFLDYDFYEGEGLSGTKVTLDDVLSAPSGVTYSMTPVVKAEYGSNIRIEFANASDEYYKFETRTIDESKATSVGPKPYISGYTDEDGVYHAYTQEEIDDFKAGKAVPSVIYTGGTFTFEISNWDTYKNYVEVWNGSISDMTRSEVGEYSVTLRLKTDGDLPYYWEKNADGSIDRSSAKLDFEIKYLLIPAPAVESSVTYNAETIDILKVSMGEAEYEAWFNNYKDYFTVSGTQSATRTGDYKLYLTIKEECGVSVRWDDGSGKHIAGTYSAIWSIEPVYIRIPTLETSKILTYDRKIHRVY